MRREAGHPCGGEQGKREMGGNQEKGKKKKKNDDLPKSALPGGTGCAGGSPGACGDSTLPCTATSRPSLAHRDSRRTHTGTQVKSVFPHGPLSPAHGVFWSQRRKSVRSQGFSKDSYSHRNLPLE